MKRQSAQHSTSSEQTNEFLCPCRTTPGHSRVEGDGHGILEADRAISAAHSLLLGSNWSGAKIRVGLMEPYDVYRLGLQEIIDQEPDMFVVYALKTLPPNCAALPPVDIALLNERLVMSQASARPPEHCPQPQAMRWRIIPAPEWLLLKQHPAMVEEVVRLCSACPRLALAAFIRRAARPQDPILATPGFHTQFVEAIDAWSPEDHAIVRHIAQGWTNRNIAQSVYLSESSVKKKLHRLMASIGCNSRSQLAAYYAQYEAHTRPL